MEVYGVVYLIWNMVNGRRYVGQTTKTLEKRFKEHCYADSLIGKAIRKHGKKNFRYGVIKSCASKTEMDCWEKYYISALNCKAPYGYNLTDGGEGLVGLKRSPEHCAKISIALKGNKNFLGKHHTKETCEKLSVSRMGENNPFYGKHHTRESCDKISVAHSGENNHFYGKHLTKEHCAKLSDSHRGQKPSNYGKHHTIKSCVKLSVSKRGKSSFKNLSHELDVHQLTYTALAKLMNLSRSTISFKMLGKRKFSNEDKEKLVEIFGKSIEYLLQRND